jgi:AP-4 complex subunit mu-1
MFSQFYVLGPRGDSIIFRSFRSELIRSTAETFFRNVRFWNGKNQDAPPVFNVDGVHYVWIKKSGLFFVLSTITNESPAAAVELLVRITKLFKDYCGILTEESVRSNFTLIYELLDEIFDWGYPQTCSTESLKAFIFNDPAPVASAGADSRSTIKLPGFSSSKTMTSTAVDKPITFRSRDRQRNQVFVDIFERLSLTFNSAGYVLNQAIDGTVQMKSYLGGNPELRLAFNEDLVVTGGDESVGKARPHAVLLDDCNFHECVKLTDFESQRVITLVPPDGEFVAMNYRVTSDFRPPFRIFPFFELTSPHKFEVAIKVRADIPEQNYGSNVLVVVPLPRIATGVVADFGAASAAPAGSAAANSIKDQGYEYDDKNKVLRWHIKKFSGGHEHMIRIRVTLSEASTAAIRKEVSPISMHFEVPMYSASRVHIKYLRTSNQVGYEMERWIRYVSRANSYVCRM